MKVEIVVFEGFDELDAIAPFEALQSAALIDGADVEVKLVTLDGAEEVTAAHGLRVRTDGQLGERPDVLIVPGGGWNNRAPKGTWAESRRGELPKAIARLHGAGSTVAAVCAGGMLAAAAGLTKGRPAVTHHLALEDLRDTGAEVVEARVVDDGDLVTAGGVTSGLDLALWLLERYFGPEVAYAVESRMEHERRGVVWRRSE
jgi:transcriptional regulator GlxA family with amidase domain